jgi:hypothetical protein
MVRLKNFTKFVVIRAVLCTQHCPASVRVFLEIFCDVKLVRL